MSSLHKPLLIVFLLSAMVFSASSAVESVWIQGNTTQDSDILLRGVNNSPVDNQIALNPPRLPEKSVDWEPESFGISADLGNFTEIGTYSIPQNDVNRSFAVGSGNNSLYSRSINLSRSDSKDNRFCPFNELDYACEYENYQGSMMSAQVKSYIRTNNSSYRENALRFALGWNETHGYSFDSYQDDTNWAVCRRQEYDCVSEYDVLGSERQGRAIKGLWDVYKVTGNATVKDRALNFTMGSADDCDIWTGKYSCNSTKGQASMMSGYWTAYAVTGNTTFRGKAENLSRENMTSPELASSYWKAYRYSGKEDYRQTALNFTENYSNECANCVARNRSHVVNSLFIAYEKTGKTSYYREAVEKMQKDYADSCGGFTGNSSCETPDDQALSVISAWKTFSGYVGDRPVYETSISDFPTREDFRPDFQSFSTGLNVWLKGPELLESCQTGISGCVFNSSLIANQTSYRFILNGTVRDSSFSAVSSIRGGDELDSARNYTREGPSAYCSIWGGDTACDGIKGQAMIISGFSDYVKLNRSSETHDMLLNLSNTRYYTSDVSGCAPQNNNFSCQSSNEPESRNTGNPEGSERQGAIIKALYSSWEVTGNDTTYQLARNFTHGSPADCDVWNSDYQCNASEGQGWMIDGFWTAYQVSGKQSYYSIAANLSAKAGDYNSTPKLADALWRSYEMTGNQTYLATAENMTEDIGADCSSCDPYQHRKKTELYSEAFRATSNETYRHELRSLSGYNFSNYWNTPWSFEYPTEQGATISTFTDLYTVLDEERDTETSLSVESTSLKVGDQTSATCSVKNLMQNTTLYNTTLEISAQGFSTGDTTYDAGDLGYLEEASNSWDLTAEKKGDNQVNCTIGSADYSEEISETVTVEEETSEDASSSSDDTTTSFNPVTTPDIDPYPEIYNYTLSTHDLEKVVSNSSEWNSSKGCYTATREIWSSNSSLRFESSCDGSKEILLYEFQNVTDAPVNYSLGVLKKTYNSTELPVEWHYSEQTENRSPGVAVLKQEEKTIEPLKVNISKNDDLNVTSYRVNLSKEVECGLYRNKSLLKYFESENFRIEPEITDGWNNYTLQCGNVSSRFSEYIETEEVDDGRSAFIPVIFLLLIGSILFIYRKTLRESYRTRRFERSFREFRDSVEASDTDRAHEIYATTKYYSDGAVEVSDITFERAMKIYLALHVISEGMLEDLDMDRKTAIMMGDNFVKNCEDEVLSRLIKEKMREIRP